MPDHVPSNFATYQKNNGAPVFQAFFVAAVVGGDIQLFAFEKEEERVKALEFQRSKGIVCEPMKHRAAFEAMRAGQSVWLYEGGNPDVTAYTPLHLAPGFKRGWIPRVIEGGAPVVALE